MVLSCQYIFTLYYFEELKMRRNLFFTLSLITTLSIFGWQSELSAQEIQWLTWEEAIEKSQKEKKKIFVDVYTDWCGWCKRMDKTTFSDPVVVNYINKNFYPVKFNAEQKEAIKFNNKEYKYVATSRRGYHELAAWMLRGKMGYPTVVFLDEDVKLIQPIQGYIQADKFELIMTYFGEDNHHKVPWDIYQKKNQAGGSKGLPAKGN